MVALIRCGFEGRDPKLDGFTMFAGNSYSTTSPHAGSACLETDSDGIMNWDVPERPVNSYGRVYWRRMATSNLFRVGIYSSTDQDNIHFVWSYSNSTFRIMHLASGNVFGELSYNVPLNAWTCIEWRVNYAATMRATIRINYTTESAEALFSRNNIFSEFTAIEIIAQGRIDDVGLNSAGGTDNNSWLGSGGTILCRPVADGTSAATWTGGAGSTTNRWNGVDNTPPQGVSLGSATNGTQIKNEANTDVALYRANCQTPTAAGAPVGSSVRAVRAVAAVGFSGGGTIGLLATTPSLAEVQANRNDLGIGGADAGIYPSGWGILQTPFDNSATLGLGATPVVLLAKRAANTNAVMASFAGLLVDLSIPVPIKVTTGPMAVGSIDVRAQPAARLRGRPFGFANIADMLNPSLGGALAPATAMSHQVSMPDPAPAASVIRSERVVNVDVDLMPTVEQVDTFTAPSMDGASVAFGDEPSVLASAATDDAKVRLAATAAPVSWSYQGNPPPMASSVVAADPTGRVRAGPQVTPAKVSLPKPMPGHDVSIAARPLRIAAGLGDVAAVYAAVVFNGTLRVTGIAGSETANLRVILDNATQDGVVVGDGAATASYAIWMGAASDPELVGPMRYNGNGSWSATVLVPVAGVQLRIAATLTTAYGSATFATQVPGV